MLFLEPLQIKLLGSKKFCYRYIGRETHVLQWSVNQIKHPENVLDGGWFYSLTVNFIV